MLMNAYNRDESPRPKVVKITSGTAVIIGLTITKFTVGSEWWSITQAIPNLNENPSSAPQGSDAHILASAVRAM